MKRVLFGFVALMATAVAQSGSPPASLFQTVRPQILLTVRRDPNGSHADLLEARTTDPRYPAEILRAQVLSLGKQLGSEPRGLLVGRYSLNETDASMTSIKATCAIDDIIDRKTSSFHLTQIARAFVGYPKPHTVTGLSILFVGETPQRKTLLAYGSEGSPVQVEGSYDPTFNGVEYRLKLNTQTPEQIEIPEGTEQNPRPRPSTVANKGFDWTVWGLILVAAIAVGALVYSLLVRSTSSKRS
jgi:hypothetical protein